MFLEAQFGPQITPITCPKFAAKEPKQDEEGDNVDQEHKGEFDMDDAEAEREDIEAEELERLHSIGIRSG